jgi:tetratricopeptide (TPR) repeat protein
VLPGLGEELFFRGFLGRGLVARYGPVRGILATSLLFAVTHVDPVQVSYTFLLGVALHVVYLTSGSFVAPVLLHTLYNLAGLTLRRSILTGTVDFGSPDGTVVVPPLLLLTALAAALLLGWLFYATRLVWRLPAGDPWTAGHVTAEMPPGDVAATPHYQRAGWAARTGATVAYGAFALALLHTGLMWFDPQTAWAHTRQGNSLASLDKLDLAIDEYTEAIRIDPNYAPAYSQRGEAYRQKSDYDSAVRDFDLALHLDPQLTDVYARRADIYRVRRQYDRALADCQRAIDLNASWAWGYTVRGAIHDDQGNYDQARVDYERSLRLDPSHAWTWQQLAWLQATCPEERYRNGRRAVDNATRACELSHWKEEGALTALAAAHGECNQFAEAVQRQKQALELATGQRKVVLQGYLELYQEGKAYHKPTHE